MTKSNQGQWGLSPEPALGVKVVKTDAPLWVKLVSAGTGACIADVATFPLDTTKVRLQVQGDIKYSGVVRTILTIFHEEGGRGLYRGLVSGLQRQLCFSTIKLGCYDDVKNLYANLLFTEDNIKPNSTPISIRILAGVTTGILSVAVAHPTDTVKVRMQAQCGNNLRYANTSDAYKKIYTKEGVKGLWRGCLPNMTRNGIVNVAEVVTYDVTKSHLISSDVMSEGFKCHLVSAFAAGFCATVVASPVDVVKTRYMNSVASQYKSAIHCAQDLWKEVGFGGFYKGFLPALLRIGTWNVLMFMSYEQIKLLIQPHLVQITSHSKNVEKATDILFKDKHT